MKIINRPTLDLPFRDERFGNRVMTYDLVLPTQFHLNMYRRLTAIENLR